MLFICHPTCTTCDKARTFLKLHGFDYTERDIRTENPTREELAKWHKQSGLPLKRFFNTSGNKYRELELTAKLPNMTEEEQLDLLPPTACWSAGRYWLMTEKYWSASPKKSGQKACSKRTEIKGVDDAISDRSG